MMKDISLIIKTLIFILFVFLICQNSYSQNEGSKLFDLLHEYETALSYTNRDADEMVRVNSIGDLFLTQNSLVADDISENNNEINQYLSIYEYGLKVQESFNENTVKLFNLKVLDIQFYTNYVVYKISVKKSIIGETINGSFFNRNIDLIIDIVQFYSNDIEQLKIQKISNPNYSSPVHNEMKDQLIGGVSLYFSPGLSKINFSNDDNSSGEYAGLTTTNDFSLKFGGNFLFKLFSGKQMDFSLGTGIGYLGYKSSLSLNSYDNGYFDYDIDDDEYYKLVSGTNIQQNIKVNYFEIPLFFQVKYHLKKLSVYLNTGIQLGISNSMHINTSQGDVNYKGQYSLVDDNGVAYEFVLEDLEDYGFGSYSLSQNDQALDIDPINLSFLLSAGISIPLNSSFELLTGVDFVSGLSSINITQSEELFSSNNINSIINSSNSFNTGFIGLNIGLQYKLNKPSTKPIIQDNEVVFSDYSKVHYYDSTDFSNEKSNNFSLPSDYSGFNLFYLDLSDESINRAKIKSTFEKSLDSVNTQLGEYFVFLSNFNKPIVVEPKSSFKPVLNQINYITPELPDVEKDIQFILESLNSQKNLNKSNRVNLFLVLSSSFYKYQSNKLITELQKYFINKNIQVYVYLKNDTSMDVELEKYNYEFFNINMGDE